VKHRGVKVISFVPGRARVKLGTLTSDAELIGALREELLAIPGIEKLKLGKFTRNVLIAYDRKRLGTPESMQALAAVLGRHFPGVDLSAARKWLEQNEW
jgi:hypothetical protein